MRFMDRTDAGRHLARSLEYLRGTDAVVLGLPRGGVPVAFEVAKSLGVPLDVIVVRKLGVPYQPELARGAIGEGGIRVSNEDVIRRGAITPQEIAAVEQRERVDLDRQAHRFREGRPHVDIAGRTAIVVDDGIATGSTASAACQVARQMGARTVILAVPVGAPESVAALKSVADDVVCVHAPAFFMAVGSFYDNFRPVSDREVSDLLAQAFDALHVTAGGPRRPAQPGGTSAQAQAPAQAPARPQTPRVPQSPESPESPQTTEDPDSPRDPDGPRDADQDTGDPPPADPPAGDDESSHGSADPASAEFEDAGRHTAGQRGTGQHTAGQHTAGQHAAGRGRGKLRHHFFPPGPVSASGPPERDEEVELRVGDGTVPLAGHLTIPAGSTGIVVFVHGSGSSRHSPRNRFVAAKLNEAGLGTLLFDLLTADEELHRANVFDIQTLASRLRDVTCWLREQPGGLHKAMGYFGASTGAAAALWAAAEPGAHVDAVVSRGGRPDLADTALAQVHSPTLLIVGGRDEVVLGLNKQAQQQMRCENRLAIVPGATHLFEEPGALQTVTRLAREWFTGHFAPPDTAIAPG